MVVSPSDLGDPSKAWYVSLDVMPSTSIETDLSSSASLVVYPSVASDAYTLGGATDAVAGGTAGAVTLRRANTAIAQTINYAIDPDSTAKAGVDFAALSGSVSFAVGQVTAAISIDTSSFSGGAGKWVGLRLASPQSLSALHNSRRTNRRCSAIRVTKS